jgi:CheY-like chemotaxis protein
MILVIEDNQKMVASMQRVFSGWGWDEKVLFDSPITAAEAIVCLAAIKPKIVCLDMNFTEDNLQEGIKVAQWIEQNLPNTTVLSISANSVEYSRECYTWIDCVKHFPRKDVLAIRQCLEGTCACQSES